MSIKTYKVGESKLLKDRKMLKLNKLEEYMVSTGVLTGVYVIPADLNKKKPKRRTRAELDKLGKAERDLYKRQQDEYKKLLDNTMERSFIDIKQSWIELCVYMLGTIYINTKDKFVTTLIDNGVMNEGFKINIEVLEYVSVESKIHLYKIPNTKYYLETSMRSHHLYKAILAMAKILNIDNDKEIMFNISAT